MVVIIIIIIIIMITILIIIIIIITIIIILYSNKSIREGFTKTHYKLYGLIIYTGKIQQSLA